jgi:Holliday junction resolvase RusA-like endonuclease
VIYYEFRIPFAAVPASRPRVARNGGVFYSKRYAEFRRRVTLWIRSKKFKMIPARSPIEVHCLFGMPMPKSQFIMGPHDGKQDLDNCIKGVLDCMQGELFDDDRYVYKLHCVKVWTDNKDGFIDVRIGNGLIVHW